MVYLNEQLIENVAQLSTRFQTILPMINNGQEWLHWAIANSEMPACRAYSENELLTIIKMGLDADMMIRLNTLKLSLNKLLSMSDGDVEQLAMVVNTTFDNDTTLQPLLLRNNLLSYKDLYEGIGFAQSQYSVNGALFEGLSFAENLALTAFVKSMHGLDPQVQQQASKFAQEKASTISGFIDLFNFFTTAFNNVLPAGTKALIAPGEIQPIYDALQPIVYQLLFTPNIGEGQTEATIRQNLPKVISSSRFIGYQTAASAMLNLLRNISVSNIDEASLKTQTESYLTTIKNQLSLTTAGAGIYSQDGSLITYTYDNDAANILVGVDATGSVFIQPETILKQTNQQNRT